MAKRFPFWNEEKDKSCKLCLMPLRKRQECRRPEGECGKFSYKKEKVALKESMQNVSRSGEKGGPFALANGGK